MFFCICWVFTHHPCASETAAADIVIRVELQHRRCAHIQKLFDPDLLLFTPNRAAIRRIVETRAPKREFSAIVCCNDLSAKVWMDELNYAGFSVPGDFAVVGYDGKSYLPMLSTIDAKGFELGFRAAEALIQAIRTQVEPANQIITAEFLARQTT